MVGKTEQVSIRLEPDVLALADEVSQLLGEGVMAGSQPARAAVMRSAVIRGLEAMKAELTERKRKRK